MPWTANTEHWATSLRDAWWSALTAACLLTRFPPWGLPVTTVQTGKKMKLQHNKWIINKEPSIPYLGGLGRGSICHSQAASGPGGWGQACGRASSRINNVTEGDWRSMPAVTLIYDQWKQGNLTNKRGSREREGGGEGGEEGEVGFIESPLL